MADKTGIACPCTDDTTTYEDGQARERIDEDTSAYHNEAWTLNPFFKRSPRPE